MKKIVYFIQLLRPTQWVKNSIIFIPLIFSGNLLNIDLFLLTCTIFFIFCIFVGSTYVINDYLDIEKDKMHPTKKNRPLASGKINKNLALIVAIILIIGTLFALYIIGNITVFFLSLLYIANTLAYSFYLKHLVIVDVFSIAFGFVVRGLIGTYLIAVDPSEWFLVMVFFGALLLGFLKRYQEVMLGTKTRKNIESYNEEFLKQIISMIVSILLFVYALYTFNSTQSKELIMTLPVVVFGIIRYYYNIFFLKQYAQSIEKIIFFDKLILGSIVAYVALALFILY